MTYVYEFWAVVLGLIALSTHETATAGTAIAFATLGLVHEHRRR